MFWTLLGYTVAKVPACPRNSTWFSVSPHDRVGSGDETRLEPCFSIPPFFFLKNKSIGNSAVIQLFPFRVPFAIVVKTFWGALEFISLLLQQWDQVTSVVHTTSLLQGHSRAYCGYKMSYFSSFCYTHSLPSLFSRLCPCLTKFCMRNLS